MKFKLDQKNLPAAMLLLLREEGAMEWSRMAKHLDFNPDPMCTVASPALVALNNLREIGVVQYEQDGIDGIWSPPQGQIELVGDKWLGIQRALNLSLRELSQLTTDAIVVSPVFETETRPLSPLDIFVLMPFSESLEGVYRDHIRGVTDALGLTCLRGDDFFSVESVMKDIWDAIRASRGVIADCTGRNPNVFYEMGIAHVLGKPVILITQNEEDVPFDLRHRRFIQYAYTPPGMKAFEELLRKTLCSEFDVA